MEREIYMRLAVVLASKALDTVDGGGLAPEANYVELALLRAKKYARTAAKIWGKE